MRFCRLKAVARKEVYHVIRDWRSLFMSLGTPVILLLLFGYALTLDVDHVPMVIWDQSHTPESRDLISQFVQSRYFSEVATVDDYRAILHAIDSGVALSGLVIPVDFAKNVQTNREAEVQLLLDGSDSNTATWALGYAEGVLRGYNRTVRLKGLARAGLAPIAPPYTLQTRIWYNPNTDSTYSIVPGLIAMIMMVIAALITSLTIAREWEKGTMETLIATPLKVPELILGKMLPYFGIGLFNVLVVVAMGEFLFHVPFRGSFWLMLIMAMLFLVGALSLGIVISIVTKSQLVASQMAMVLTFLPSFLLSGFLTVISNMPEPIQVITYAVPARYFLTLLQGIYLKGVGLEVLYQDALFLMAFSLMMLVLAHALFKKKLV